MIAFRAVSRSFKNCSKFAFIQKVRTLTLTCSQTNNNYKSKKTAFFKCVFLFSYENVFHDVLLQFYLIHFSHYFLSSRSRSLAFHKDSYKKLLFDCVCVFFNLCSCFLSVYLWLAVYLLQYQIANMVQISQINLICFFSSFFC